MGAEEWGFAMGMLEIKEKESELTWGVGEGQENEWAVDWSDLGVGKKGYKPILKKKREISEMEECQAL